MSHVKEISIKLNLVKFPDQCLNLSKCTNIEKINLDFGISNYQPFMSLVKNYFNTYTDLSLPKIFKERGVQI
jgi:hypothetical protein